MATIAGTLRAAVIAAAPSGTKPDGSAVSLGARVFREDAPDGATMPYVTFGDVTDTVEMSGDGKVTHRGKQMQWDLWEKRRDESDTLLDSLVAALSGVDMTVATLRPTRTRVPMVTPVADPDRLISHHAITVTTKYRVG